MKAGEEESCHLEHLQSSVILKPKLSRVPTQSLAVNGDLGGLSTKTDKDLRFMMDASDYCDLA